MTVRPAVRDRAWAWVWVWVGGREEEEEEELGREDGASGAAGGRRARGASIL